MIPEHIRERIQRIEDNLGGIKDELESLLNPASDRFPEDDPMETDEEQEEGSETGIEDLRDRRRRREQERNGER